MIPKTSEDATRALEGARDALVRRLVPDSEALWARLKADDAETLRAATYDGEAPSQRVDGEGHALPDYADPTGDTATLNASRPSELAEHAADLDALARVVDRLSARHARFMRDRLALPPVDEDGPGDLWCRSCWRVSDHGGHPTRSPIATRYSKLRLCRWCGDKRADEDFPKGKDGYPPVELVRRYLGPVGYVSTRDVEQWRRAQAEAAKQGVGS